MLCELARVRDPRNLGPCFYLYFTSDKILPCLLPTDVGEASEHDDRPLRPGDRRQALAALRPQRRGVRGAPVGRYSGMFVRWLLKNVPFFKFIITSFIL